MQFHDCDKVTEFETHDKVVVNMLIDSSRVRKVFHHDVAHLQSYISESYFEYLKIV